LSIFVNPTQFGPNEDLSRYPRTFEKDLAIAKREGVDLIFAPLPSEVYPESFSTYVEETSLSQPLCGKFRPGHFRGVTTVVLKLFNLIRPQLALFGLKDAQQFFVLDRMVRDLNLDVLVEGIPTVRESDGLAMSSRNVYLSPTERENAPFLFQTLTSCRNQLLQAKKREEIATIIEKSRIALCEAGFEMQYLEYRQLPHFVPMENCSDFNQPGIVAAAGYLGKTRLIDNIMVRPEGLRELGIQIEMPL
jgi:pantoate--beta-alanine ligase